MTNFTAINEMIQIQKTVEYLALSAKNAIRFPLPDIARLQLECDTALEKVVELKQATERAGTGKPDSAESIAKGQVAAFLSNLYDDLRLAQTRLDNRVNQIEWKRGMIQ